jgi:uncharacterized membrane protein YfhO
MIYNNYSKYGQPASILLLTKIHFWYLTLSSCVIMVHKLLKYISSIIKQCSSLSWIQTD